MTDDRMDVLLRQLDVTSEPNAAFAEQTLDALLPRVHRARYADTRWLGRVSRALRATFGPSAVATPASIRPIVLLVVLALVLLVAVLAVALVGARPSPSPLGNGPLMVATPDGLRRIESGDSSASTVVVSGRTKGASRSPDGRLVSFWTASPSGDQLEVVAVDGVGRRTLTTGMRLTWNGCIDTWASDSHAVAAEVLIDGVSRILVADVASGSARLRTPRNVDVLCPLWAPDGGSIAFAMKSDAGQTLAVIGIDGQGLREVSGLAADVIVAGPDSWSPDGSWIYFGAAVSGQPTRVYRADVAHGVSQGLTLEALGAAAPALSPDGHRIAFIVRRDSVYDLYASNADGTDVHLVLANAVNDGWSADGQLILADWRPPSGGGGLLTIGPDGTGQRVVYPFPSGCIQTVDQPGCVDSIGWGQPRP
jgi:Periplasmic component of the Tol biopolymer transport system